MSRVDFFEDEEGGAFQRPEKPIWAIGLDDPGNDATILKWLNGEADFLSTKNRQRFEEIRRNLAWWKGIQEAYRERSQDSESSAKPRTYLGRFDAADTFDLVLNRVARLVKYKPAVSILPANDEHADKIAAKSTKQLLDFIWYQQQFEDVQLLEIATRAMTEGECFVLPTWNPDLGDLHPSYKKIQGKVEAGEEVPLLDENGKPELDEQNNPIMIKQEIRTGDVEHVIVSTLHARLHDTDSYAKCKYLMWHEEIPVEEARLRHPKQAAEIREGVGADILQIYDVTAGYRRPKKNHVLIWHLLYRRSKELPGGRYLTWTKDVLLENDELPYTLRDQPWERLTDDDFPDEVHGRSFISRVRPMVSGKRKLDNMILRNIFMVSHPKWMVPAGSVKLDSLGNDVTIAQFKGPMPPALVQANPTPAEVFNFRNTLATEVWKKAQIGDIARGSPPPNIKAFVALQFMSEQEQEMFNQLILKLNTFIKNVARKDLAVAGDYYEASDERMIRVQGRDNTWLNAFFDVAHLSKPYDIRIQNSSALPQSKGARTQAIMDLSQQFPGMIPQEQIVEILDLGQSDKFVSQATVSVRAAEAENEMIIEGKPVKPPEKFEDLVLHWKIHAKMIQDWGFKNQAPDKVRKAGLEHMNATEYLMVQRAEQLPPFQQILMSLPGFPLVYEMPDPNAPPPTPPGAPQGGAPGAGGPQDQSPAQLNQQEPIQGAEPGQDVAPPMPNVANQTQAAPIAPTQGS